MGAPELRVIGVGGLPEVRPGDALAALLAEAAARQGTPLEAGDVVVVTQKVVSKAEGRTVALTDVEPGPDAVRLAAETEKDPRLVELVLRESRRIVRPAGPGGVTGQGHPVVISDTCGRPWREGHTNVAVGLAGMALFADYVGQVDPHGYELRVSSLAVADELAAAAELVMGKLSGVPVAIVRGYEYPKGCGTAREIVRPPERDLFRSA